MLRTLWLTTAITLAFVSLPRFAAAQCSLVITDPPAVCGFETVDLTAASVTQGSTPGMQLTYWKDAAATLALTNPGKVDTGGTYYIKGMTAGGCIVVKPVTLRIQNPPSAEIYYPGMEFCRMGPPAYVLMTGTQGGTFSASPMGLDIDSLSGTVVPAASMPGKYIVTYSIPPQGICPAMVVSAEITIKPLLIPSFASVVPLCLNTTAPVLPSTSPEGITGTWSPAVISTAVEGVYTFTFTPDAGLCSASATMDIVINGEDITPPILILPPSITIDCNQDASPAGTGSATATDNCSYLLSITYRELRDTLNCEGSITRIWTAEDQGGNSCTGIQVITVIPATGTGDLSDPSGLLVYPNPGNGMFNIECTGAAMDIRKLIVTDMTSRTVLEIPWPEVSAKSAQLRMPAGSGGMYILQVVTGQGVVRRKVVVRE